MNLSTRVSLFYGFLLIFYNDQYNDKKIHNIRLLMFSSSLSSNWQLASISYSNGHFMMLCVKRLSANNDNNNNKRVSNNAASIMFNAHDEIGADQILRKAGFIAISKYTHAQTHIKSNFHKVCYYWPLATCFVVKWYDH